MICRWLAILIALAAVPAAAGSGNKNTTGSDHSTQKSSAVSEGERAFRQNCGRCHKPPEQLSPSAVPAVIHHMRVRAMLPQKEADAILHYLAP